MRMIQEYWESIGEVVENIPNIESIYGSKVLITGGTGMICSSVADILFYLNREKDAKIGVILAGRSEERVRARFEYMDASEYKFLKYDATENKKIEIDTDYIIHGASNANPSVYAKEPVETMLANIIGLNTLLELASKNEVKRLLYVSSSEVYGKKEGTANFSEDDYGYVDILNPRASYPSAKRAAETLSIAYSDEHGLDVVIVRPGHIYGPTITKSDTRASAQFSRNAVNNMNIIMKSDGLQLRSYCYTLDCATALLAVLIKGENREAYNISNKDSIVTIREMATSLAEASNTEVIYENPSDIEKKGYNLMPNSALDSKKLEDLGWKASFDIKKGSEETINLLKKMEDDQ